MKPRPPMRLPSLRSALASSLFFLGLSTAGYVQANGTEALGAPDIAIASGSSVATAGVGLDDGSGVINIGIPAGATVKQVLLYWSSRGDVARRKLKVNGTEVTGDVIGGPAPTFPSGTEQGPSRSYRFDLTSMNLVDSGPNAISVESVGTPRGGLEGASIVAIFGDRGIRGFGGRAFAIGVPQLGPLQSFIADTGELPPSGGALTPAPVVKVKIPKLLTARVVDASVVGAGGQTASFASVAALKLLTLGLGVVQSTATAECRANGNAKVSGGSRILGASGEIFGQTPSFDAKLAPNTVVLNIAGLVKLVANEQTRLVSGSAGTITVTALHLTSPLKILTNAIDVKVASSRASIECGVDVPDSAITVLDGNDFAFDHDPFTGLLRSTSTRTFNIAPVGFNRTAQLHLLVGDAEEGRPDVIQITVDDGPIKTIVDTLNGDEGLEWDDDLLLVDIPSGATKLTVKLLSRRAPRSDTPMGISPDSFHWVAAIVSLPTTRGAGINLYSGRATVVRADVLTLVDAVVADTGPLPPSGGQLKAEILNVDIPLLLASSTARARTVGAGEVSAADAILEDLDLTLGATLFNTPLGLSISADLIKSNAVATCSASNVAVVAGSSEVGNLVINGNPFPLAIDGTLDLPLGIIRILVNEKLILGNNGGNSGAITVNAIRITVPDLFGFLGAPLVNIVLASSHADIVCQ